MTLRVQNPAGKDLHVPGGWAFTPVLRCCGHCFWWQEGRNTRLKGEERFFITVSGVQCAEFLQRSAQELTECLDIRRRTHLLPGWLQIPLQRQILERCAIIYNNNLVQAAGAVVSRGHSDPAVTLEKEPPDPATDHSQQQWGRQFLTMSWENAAK